MVEKKGRGRIATVCVCLGGGGLRCRRGLTGSSFHRNAFVELWIVNWTLEGGS